MIYVKDFIEPEYQVPLDFDSLVVNNSTEKETTPFYHKLFAVIAFVLLFYSVFKTWWISCLLLTLFFFFIVPFSFKWMQRKMGVVFPSKFIWALITFFSVSIFVSINVYHRIDTNRAIALKQEEEELKLAKEHKLAVELAAKEEAYRLEQEKNKRMTDSLEFHKNIADDYYKKKNFSKALEEYIKALNFEGYRYYPEIYKNVATIFYTQKKYPDALKYYQKIQSQTENIEDDTLAYQKALCYVNIGDVPSAVHMLRFAPETKRTNDLFNRINPIKTRTVFKDIPVTKREISYYTTICGDGSHYNKSSRRGACSRHGGVASWSSPVYRTYETTEKRKFYEKYREYGER